MPAYTKHENNSWVSTPIAMGPFTGLQGGGIAGLLVTELEQMAAELGLGRAVSASVEFLRPTLPGEMRSEPVIIRQGRRASVLQNRLFQNDRQTAQASVCVIAPSEMKDVPTPQETRRHPASLEPLPPKQALHKTPWMMDNFYVRRSDEDIIWFEYIDPIVDGMTPLASVLGPADWTHGLGRPTTPKLADPNLNLQVTVGRHPTGSQIGILPNTVWHPSGIGFGEGTLFDEIGTLGRVMMSVALTELG